MTFTNAILRTPSINLCDGITSVDLGKPDYQLALQQHEAYHQTLKSIGLKTEVLEALDDFPDATFVEDVALVKDNFAVVTNPGAASRNKEQHYIKPVLPKYFDHIHQIIVPGTLDAGDVMMVDDHFYIGLSARTNLAGALQLILALEKYGKTGSYIPLKEVLHLKTGVNYLDNNNLLVCGEFVEEPVFEKFNKIIVPKEEAYAANSLWVNGTVIVPKGFPFTQKAIEGLGYQTIVLDMSEFEKLDGGLSCLSLRF